MATSAELFLLAGYHHQAGNVAQAEQLYRQVLQVDSTHVQAWTELGAILFFRSDFGAAADCFRRLLQLNPHDATYHYNLGLTLQRQDRDRESVDYYRQAVKLNPNLVLAWNNLGIALKAIGQIDEAIACYRHALQLQPEYPEGFSNLANALTDRGEMEEAVRSHRRALQLNPAFPSEHSNLVYALHFCPDVDALTLFQEHRRWSQLHADPLAKSIRAHGNDRSVSRRLRIGYISPDYRWHPVGRFLLPLLEAHDRAQFEIFCYASQTAQDATTAACHAQAGVWRNVYGVGDEQVAHLVRQDKIDILVDLTMHMANNRLLVCARKPAPVQVTYLAYCSTTGLTTIDYRLTDPYLDPPGFDDRVYSERSIHLPETYWCYQEEKQSPAVNALPALKAGHVTFGCLNNFCKVTPATLETWSRILQAVPGSRLLLHAHAGSHRDRVRALLAQRKVGPERLTFVDFLPPVEYFRIHERLDVALDPFPYGGGTTTCDALWMGVPVVSLAGPTAVGRGGLSILSNVGLANLVAGDAEQLVKIAVELAGDLPRLSGLRSTLRERMRGSPLMDAPRFARNVELAYREMWRRWCGAGV